MGPSPEQQGSTEPEGSPRRGGTSGGGAGAPGDAAASEDGGSLPGELSEFLVELGRLVQKHQVYPVGHPALTQTGLRAAEAAAEALDALGGTRELRITVLRDTLEVEGTGRTRPENRVCRTVARSLHDRHAAALRVKQGVSEGEMRNLGRWLASGDADEGDGEEGEESGSARTARRRMDRDEVPEPPKLEHLVVELLPYDALRLRRSDLPPDDPDAGAEQIWRELAAVAHGLEDAEDLAESRLQSGSVGEALADRIHDPGVAELVRTMARRVLRRAESAAGPEEGERSEYAERLDEVLDRLGDEQLGELLAGDRASEEDVRALILEAAPHLSPENLERLVRAADDHEYLEISDWLLRVLTKLVRHSRSDGRGVRSVAERQVRRQVRDLVVQYHGDSPNTASYAAALRRMSRPDVDAEEPTLSLAPPSSERLLLVGVETDCGADAVLDAWEQHVEGMPLRDRILWLAEAPEGGLTDRLREEVLEGDEPLRALLSEQPPAREAAARVIDWTGEAAIGPLMEILAEAERRQVRRFAFDQLGSLGGAVEAYALERLDDDRWYVRRNLLSLLSKVATPPFDLPLGTHLRDPHEAVRREAIRLGMLDPEWRDRALETALEADDRQTLTVGLAAALEGGYPTELSGRIAEVARDDSRSLAVRRRAVRALASSDAPEARKTLLGLARRRRWPFFWQYRLRPKSGVVLEALSGLKQSHGEDPEVEEVLREARSSDDPEIREAAGGTS